MHRQVDHRQKLNAYSHLLLWPVMLISADSFGQAETADAPIEKVLVTGSRLKPIHIEGPSPVTIIDRLNIEKSGASTLAELLQSSILNTFGARKAQGGSTGGRQGQATVSLRGLGEQRTLILVNGRRIANSAALPDSQNINLIPLAAIKRVEILRDGASSVYGSDAIGGVVNIILYKDRSEHQISLKIDRPESAGGDVETIELSGGISSKSANITYAISHIEHQPLKHKDFAITNVGLSPFGFPGSYTASTVDSSTGLIYSTTVADNRCPQTLSTDSAYSSSKIKNNQCQFNYADYTTSQPKSAFNSLVLDGNLDISDNDKLYANVFISKNSTHSVSAPTPHAGGVPFLPTMDANNPNNPTLGQTLMFDTNGDGIEDSQIMGPFDIDIYYRNVAGGPRQTHVDDKMVSTQWGWEHKFASGNEKWEFTLFYDRNSSDESSEGLSRRDLLQAAIDDGSFDLFAVNDETDLQIAESFRFNTGFTAEFETQGLRTNYQFELFNDDSKNSDSILGVEYIEHDYISTFKDKLTGNQIDGRAGGGNAAGKRNIMSFFAETNYPLTKNLAINLALRYDKYSDFGSSLNPKLGLVYRLTENWLVRSSVSTGFRAPSLFELFSGKNQGFTSVIDERFCQQADIDRDGRVDQQQDGFEFHGNHPCLPVRVQTITNGNPNLKAEHSNSFTIGTVYQPDKNFRVALNLYSQTFTDQILRLPVEEVTKRDANIGASDRIHRNASGTIQSIDVNYDNFSGVRTAGLDFELSHTVLENDSGRWGYFANLSGVFMYEAELIKGEGFGSINGEAGNPNERAEFGIDWQKDRLDARLKIHYVPTTTKGAVNFESWWFTEFQLQWQTPWKSHLTFGVNNLFNEMPPNDLDWGFPYYDNSLFPLQGRVPYLRFTQEF